MVNKASANSRHVIERRRRIVERVQETGRATVDELAGAMKASLETIRRDLAALAQNGQIRKIHGGAAAPALGGEGSFAARLSDGAAAKRRIAAAAVGLFTSGDSLFIDTGTTTLAFAEALSAVPSLHVITNSQLIANAMARGEDQRVMLLGGAYRSDGHETLGPLTQAQVAHLRARYCVLTVAAIHADDGVMDFDLDEATLARAMMARAERIVVLADSSKLNQYALFEVAPLDRIDVLVTDQPPKAPLAEHLETHDIKVIIAPA